MSHKFIVFDTETTSLNSMKNGKAGGEVIQFAAVIVDEVFNIVRVINRYCSTTQFIVPEAEKVHGLSDKKVSLLSDDTFFEQVVEEENLRKLDNVTWIGYNVGFDIKMVRQTLIQNGNEPINFGSPVSLLSFDRKGLYYFDAMYPLSGISGFAHKRKLSALIEDYIGLDLFRKICLSARQKYSIVDPLIGHEDYFHNAFFDSFGLLILIQKFKNSLLF